MFGKEQELITVKDTRKNTAFSTSCMNNKVKIGVSACLLGHTVRFDGGHKKNPFISVSLARYADLQPVCPEVEAGFNTPRPAMQLRQQGQTIKLLVSKNIGQDFTEQMNHYARTRVLELGDLDGYIFKKNSPSCGLFQVPVVINRDGYRQKSGRGLYAQAFVKRFPLTPVEEEGRLNDVRLRENFFERVYAYRRWKSIANADTNVHGFIKFHSRHKLLLMARGSSYYQELGRVVSGTTKADLAEQREIYIHRFMQIMSLIPTPGRQVNVLQHILGYLKQVLSREDKQELLQVFEAYRQRQLPLITPITLLRHYLRIHPQSYINQQHYLAPYPEQLAFRSYV